MPNGKRRLQCLCFGQVRSARADPCKVLCQRPTAVTEATVRDHVLGNELDRKVTWKSGTDVSALAGKPVRLRLSMKDADIFSFQSTK